MVTMASLPSPCISICQIDPATGECLGCYRTRQEIASWPRLDDTSRLQLLEQLKDRRAERTGRRRRPSRRAAV